MQPDLVESIDLKKEVRQVDDLQDGDIVCFQRSEYVSFVSVNLIDIKFSCRNDPAYAQLPLPTIGDYFRLSHLLVLP